MDYFDFDMWAKLYEENPVEYERKRAEWLNEQIQKAPVETRNNLRLLQMECDAIHNSMSPEDAAAEMSKMMMQKLSDLKTSLTQLRAVCEDILHPE